MEIRLLGPVQLVSEQETPVQLARRQRALLAALAIEPGRVVDAERLTDVAWGQDLPADPVNALQGRISQLRKALGGDSITMEGGGYRLTVNPTSVDSVRFTSRTSAAGRHIEGLSGVFVLVSGVREPLKPVML